MGTQCTRVAPVRLAVVISHPIQYYAPWFAHIASLPDIDLRVFYLWDFGVTSTRDRDFGVSLQWDVPLLEGYEHEFVPNASRDPGTHRFRGLDNPDLVERVAHWRPDVILLFGYTYVSHLRLLRARQLRNVPVILRGDSHDAGRPRGPRTWLTQRLRRAVLRRVDAFLAVGQLNAEYFRSCARRPDQVIVAPHFVDNRRFREWPDRHPADAVAWRRSLGIDDDAFVFGFAGKFEAKKRPWDLLTASEQVARLSGRTHVVLFVGAGDGLSSLRQLSGPRIGRDVFFAPFQNQSEMPRAYASMDVLVLPSGFGETWGLCVNEAMNLGVPAIVSDVVGCGPDLVRHGRTGWIFPAGDIDALCKVMDAALARSDEQRAAMSEAARTHVASYSIETATRGLVQAIDRATGSQRAVDAG